MSFLIKTYKDKQFRASGLDLAAIFIFSALILVNFVSKSKVGFTFWSLQTATWNSQMAYWTFWDLQVYLYLEPMFHGCSSPSRAPPTPLKMGLWLLWNSKPLIIMTMTVGTYFSYHVLPKWDIEFRNETFMCCRKFFQFFVLRHWPFKSID